MCAFVRGWQRGLIVLALVIGLAGASRAQDPDKAGRSESGGKATGQAKGLEQQIYDSLHDVINTGADLYNNYQDRAGCYRLYQGSLLTLRPLLGQHPDLQKAIDAGFANADRQQNAGARAFALRETIDKIRESLKPGGSAPAVAGSTLWNRLGGEANVRKVVDDFVALAATDPKVNFDRNGKYKLDAAKVAELKNQLVAFVSMASGGPLKYTGRSMKEIHKGMGITDAEFDATAADLKKALEKNGAKPEDVDAVLKAVGGTRNDIVEGKKAAAGAATTLWLRLGGEANVRKVVDDFVGMAAADPKVNFDRNGKYKLDDKTVATLKQKLVELISAVSEGPLDYTGKSMKDVHKGMGITDAEFDATAADLKKALERNGAAPADVEAVLKVVGGTRKDIVEGKSAEKPVGTLWERLGGEANVKKVVDDFVATAAADPKVNFDRNGKYKLDPDAVAKLKTKLVEFVSAATGGPLKYSGKSMKDAHKGMGITEAEFNAAAMHLKKALEKNGAKPDDVDAVINAVDGTRKDIVEEK
jgi:hemoglobin